MTAFPIHPFPARMAPEIALAQCGRLGRGAVVLDPMAGSGTVLRAAAEEGLAAIGFDADPLAVLMASVWTTPINPDALRAATEELISEAQSLADDQILLLWMDTDAPTRKFVDYWFGPSQQADLRRLSYVLAKQEGPISDALRIALSRIIITKDRGASLGRDVSHSRPHRTRVENDFPVMREFARSAERVANRLESQPPPGGVRVELGDARNLKAVGDRSIDAVVTSPPYLNAIDYIRGHRLSLVWLGHQVGDLKAIRSDSIGAERSPNRNADGSTNLNVASQVLDLGDLQPRVRRMVDRYLIDLSRVLAEVRRVLRVGGRVTFVVGNSCLRGIFVDNAGIVQAAACDVGLTLIARHERELPPSRRYLPPPVALSASELAKRMRTEVVLSFAG